MTLPLLVDTDLATDPDDLLALLFVAGSPEFELCAVTTTYGDTALRAAIAEEVLASLGLTPVVAAGPSTTSSGRPVWYAGNEPMQLEGELPLESASDAVETILAMSHEHAGELVVAAIGPLTNLAAALEADPTLPERVRMLVLMGADFADPSADEHNVRSDAIAAGRVFAAGFTARAIGVEQTRRLHITPPDLDRWTGDGRSPLRRRLVREFGWWKRFNDMETILVHDPLAIAMASHPELFTFRTGAFEITVGDDEGRAVPVDDGPPIDVVADADLDVLERLIVDRIADALAAADELV